MSEPTKTMHLTTMLRPITFHTGGWRYPGSEPNAGFDINLLKKYTRQLEAAKVDAVFLADDLAVPNVPMDALARSVTSIAFEPATLLASLSSVTERIGLVATASTTYEAPFHVARRFASLDHLSAGRAAWNMVTTENAASAKNFGEAEHMNHADRYVRAREFYTVVSGLWDSFADDAFVCDPESGIFLDTDKMHVLDHKGDLFNVRGPLNIPRAPQGKPVVFQAGQSPPGRQLAAETADVVFCTPRNKEAAQELYVDLHKRVAAAGRDPAQFRIMPCAFIIIGDTVAEAKKKQLTLDSLIYYENGISILSNTFGVNARDWDPNGPVPENLPETNASQSDRNSLIKIAKEEGLNVRQLAQRCGGCAANSFIGTVESVADEMCDWMQSGAGDGFTLFIPYVPAGLDDITEKLIPELQRRGVFRTEYAGRTLREHFNLDQPANKFF
ncbi:hypothetical protein Sste5344_006287 [Sporothrix stenoceras]